MSEPKPSLAEDAARIRRLHEERAKAELAAATAHAPGSDVVPVGGDLLAEVALVKGRPGPAEASGGRAISGADGEAAAKALEALGWDPAKTFGTLSRPDPSLHADTRAARLRAQIEAVDPLLVVALDAEAAEDLAAAFGLPELGFGTEVAAAGRRLLAVDGLEASLGDPKAKQRVWRQFAPGRPPGPVY